MGLWMGGSILSIIHLVVFFVLYAGDKGTNSAKQRLEKTASMRRNVSSISTFAETVDTLQTTESDYKKRKQKTDFDDTSL